MANRQRNIRKIIPTAALALAGVAAVAFAVGAASHGPLAFAADPSSSPAANTQPGGSTGGGWMHMGGMHMGRGMRGPGEAVSITVTAINGTKLSLQTTDGWTRTIDAAGATVTKGGQTASLGDIKVGDTINFRESRQTDGTYKITSIEIVLPEMDGTVSAVNGNSVTVKLFDGSTKTITVTSATTYQLAGPSNGAASKSDLVAGVQIDAVGTNDSAGNFTATTIRIAPSMVSGTVASKTASSIVITTADGKSVTVKVSSSTTYRVPSQASATLANVATGDRIVAEGKLNSDGSLSASAVMAAANDQPGFGFGMGRGHMEFPGSGRFGPGTMPAAPSAAPTANQ